MTAVARGFAIFVLLLMAATTAAAPLSEEHPDHLVATSSGSHLWFILPHVGDPARVDLCHHAFASEGPHGRALLTLPRAPEALAAWGSRLWLIFPAAPTQQPDRREIYRLQIVRDPITAAHLPRPPDRLEAEVPLPFGGAIIDFAGGPLGPIVLLRAVATPEDGDGERAEPGRRMLRLHRNAWVEVELPPDAEMNDHCQLAVAGEEGELLQLLCPDEDAGRAVLWARGPDLRWSSAVLESPTWTWRDVIRVDAQIAGVLLSPERRLRIAYLRPTQLIDLVTLDEPDRPWTLLGARHGIRLLTVVTPSAEKARPRPFLQSIDPISGAAGEEERIVPQPVDLMGRLRLPILLAIVIVAGGMVLFLRPLPRLEPQILAGWDVASPGARLAALLLDVLPSAVLAMLLLGAGPRDLLVLPLMTSSADDWLPYLTMVLITMAHSVLSELATGRTLGKLLMNERLARPDGSAPAATEVIRRNLVKTLVLLVPPLMIVVLLTPNRQGLQDLAGPTLVVRRREVEE